MMISLAAIRKLLAFPKTSWQICLLAIIGGCASALLVILFTLTIEQIQQLYLIKRDNYSSLDDVSRFDLPIIGAIIILFIAWFTGYKYIRTGIPFVLHRLKVAHGYIPFKNTINQFWGSAVALASGFSVGREGPAVHLGAACGSYIAKLLKLPFNSVRVLCACGIAAGISATFNTPIAAVIFVMEVIMREYKVHIFVPIMLASIAGSLITQYVLGASHNYEFISAVAVEVKHYPLLITLAVFLAMLAAFFNKYLVLIIKKSAGYHVIPRLMVAALITGVLGYLIPHAMGTGSSAVDVSVTSTMEIKLLLSLLAAKLIMTMFAIGLGIPGGIIGPSISIGAISGAAVSAIGLMIYPDENIASSLILMGMAGFMAASLNAPLAALLAVIELSGQLGLILPAMIVITVASLISRQLFKNESIFTMQLDAQNLLYDKPPIEESLQNIGVLAAMKENTVFLDKANTKEVLGELLSHQAEQLIINTQYDDNEDKSFYWMELDSEVDSDDITASKVLESQLITHKLIPLSHRATLAEAYLALVEQREGAVYIYESSRNQCMGLVTFEQLRIYLVEGKLT